MKMYKLFIHWPRISATFCLECKHFIAFNCTEFSTVNSYRCFGFFSTSDRSSNSSNVNYGYMKFLNFKNHNIV